jgi:hypothetical protein
VATRQTTSVAQIRDKDLGVRAAVNLRCFGFDCEVMLRAPWLVLPKYHSNDKLCWGKEKMCFCINYDRTRNDQF